MSNYFELKGKLVFPNEEIAKQVYDLLLHNRRSLFYVPAKYMEDNDLIGKILVLDGKVLRFDEKNFAEKEAINDTKDLMNKAVDLSEKGSVLFREGLNADKTISRQYKSSL